jgi:hypothetical protein
MQPHRFTEEELRLTLEKYPKLKQESDGVLKGEIDLNHQFGDVPIVDSFQISIEVDDQYPESFPRLTEIGGRTKYIAEKYKITDYRDLHCYAVKEAGAACVCAPQEKRRKFPKGNDLVDYVNDLVIPYLYGLSYFEKFKKWPWGDRSHGALGTLEAYSDIDQTTVEDITQTLFTIRIEPKWIDFHKQLKKPNPKKTCPCKSEKAFGVCHEDAFNGLKKLAEDARLKKVNIKQVFDLFAHNLSKKH